MLLPQRRDPTHFNHRSLPLIKSSLKSQSSRRFKSPRYQDSSTCFHISWGSDEHVQRLVGQARCPRSFTRRYHALLEDFRISSTALWSPPTAGSFVALAMGILSFGVRLLQTPAIHADKKFGRKPLFLNGVKPLFPPSTLKSRGSEGAFGHWGRRWPAGYHHHAVRVWLVVAIPVDRYSRNIQIVVALRSFDAAPGLRADLQRLRGIKTMSLAQPRRSNRHHRARLGLRIEPKEALFIGSFALPGGLDPGFLLAQAVHIRPSKPIPIREEVLECLPSLRGFQFPHVQGLAAAHLCKRRGPLRGASPRLPHDGQAGAARHDGALPQGRALLPAGEDGR